MTDASPLDALRADHAAATAAIQSLADFISGMSEAAATPWPLSGETLRARAEDLRNLLLLHFRREEEALFPEAIAMISKGAPRVDILSQFFEGQADDDLTAHTVMRSRMKDLLSAIEEARAAREFTPKGIQQMRTVVSLLADILRRHMEKEHTLVFPMIERMLGNPQMARVAERMGRIHRAT